MKVSTEWINHWLRRTISDDAIVQAIEKSGIEIEQIISSKAIDRKVVVGLVKKVAQHPDADSLHVTEVTVGGDPLHIVCGAPNVREGLKVAVAQVGTTLPDGTVIKKAKLRGQPSEGMLCSERELSMGTDHNGILELETDAEVGTSLCDIVNSETIVDIKTAANRPDLQSVVGIAREVGALSGVGMKELGKLLEMKEAGSQVLLEAPASLVPRFVIAELELGATGKIDMELTRQIHERLEAGGMRPISPVVDVTNYVMLEYGQPLHAYDAEVVTLPFGARLARDGEFITTLDDVKRTLTQDDLVITDAKGLIGLAGVMGGASSQTTSSTSRIYLEAASFGGSNVRKTAKRLGLRSEASARFERGVPLQSSPLALSEAVRLLEKVAGAKLVGQPMDTLRVWPWIQRIGLRQSKLTKLLGFSLDKAEIIETLASLEIEAKPFNIASEAKKHLGKPYKFGASFKADGTEAFDCSYLTDYIYSLIGLPIGHTAHQQFKNGQPVELDDLRPGDLVFRGGPFEHRDEAEREGVSHVGICIGDGRMIHAIDIQRGTDGQWQDRVDQVITDDPLEVITGDPAYLGARRYVDDLDDFISVEQIPWWRPDLKLPEDLIEEVVRVIGYDRVPATIPSWRPTKLVFDPQRRQLTRLKDRLSDAGLFEVMTYSFVSEEQLGRASHDAGQHLKLANPLSSEQAYLRSSLLPSHLQVAARNRTYGREFGFYEFSRVFKAGADAQAQPDEPLVLGVTYVSPEDSYRQVKGLLDQLAWDLGLELTMIPSEAATPFAAGRSAEIKLGRHVIGTIGQLDPVLVKSLKIRGEVAHLELQASEMLAAAKPRQFAGIDRYPATSRDVTVVVADLVNWSQVTGAIGSSAGLAVEYLGEFRPADIEAGHRTITFRLVLTHPDRTPTDAEMNEREAAVIAKLTRVVKAKIRA